MQVSAIVVAAGSGLRFQSRLSKVLAQINSKPILIYSLLVLSKHPLVKKIIVVVNAKSAQSITRKLRQYRIAKISRIVEGGKRRQDSVLNGLKALGARPGLVLIHDAARPFIDKGMISRLIKEAKSSGAAIAGVPVKATIKSIKVSKYQSIKVERTLERNKLWEIQTPQVFDKELLLRAHKKFSKIDVTDDAALLEKLGVKVSVVLGSYNNIKITTPEDLLLAEVILKNRLRCLVT